METDRNLEDDTLENYLMLKEIVDLGLANALKAGDLHEAKGMLIEVQSHFKGLKLRREDREELYARLQIAFTEVNSKIEDERLKFESEAFVNYVDLKPAVGEAIALANKSRDFRSTWDFLIGVQGRIKGARLLREQREELFAGLQDAFTMVKLWRDEERQSFETEAQQNYIRLKALVEKGLTDAGETHEYKETREYLKKIQAEFKGIKMAHEQREELYSRLQTAFDILGKRLEEFFRNKKKNWEVKMQYKLSQYSVDIFELHEALKKEQSYLSELEDKFDIVSSSGKDSNVKTGLQARIQSARAGIERKQEQIMSLEIERDELQMRLEQPDTDDEN